MLHILKDIFRAGYWLNFHVRGKTGLYKGRTPYSVSCEKTKHRPKAGSGRPQCTHTEENLVVVEQLIVNDFRQHLTDLLAGVKRSLLTMECLPKWQSCVEVLY